AVSASVTHVRLHVNRVELSPDDGSSRAAFKASRASAMFADVGRKQPGERAGILRANGHGPFDERHVAPGGSAEAHSIVIGHAGEQQPILGQLVTLLA